MKLVFPPVFFSSSFSLGGYSYEKRILRFEGAQLIRFRWYGSNDSEGDKTIFIERYGESEQSSFFSLSVFCTSPSERAPSRFSSKPPGEEKRQRRQGSDSDK